MSFSQEGWPLACMLLYVQVNICACASAGTARQPENAMNKDQLTLIAPGPAQALLEVIPLTTGGGLQQWSGKHGCT